jgi:TetR/AcrR family fatty acid metabolism transcriptional regulator
VVKEAVAQGEFRPDVSPALVRDMIYGCIEHRTWAFLRNEGDFDTDATADGITDVVFGGLVARKPEDEPMAKAISRMEDVAARLERLAGSQGD